MVAGERLGEGRVAGARIAEREHGERAQVGGDRREVIEVDPRLLENANNCAQCGVHGANVLGRQGQILGAIETRQDVVVEARIERPGRQHAMAKLEPVHLGAYQVVVDLLLYRPAVRIDCRQLLVVTAQLGVLLSMAAAE